MSWLISKRTAFLVSAAVAVEHLAYTKWPIFFFVAYPVFAVYLVVLSEIKNFRQAIVTGFLATTVAGFLAFHWISFVLSEMAGFPTYVSVALHALFNSIVLPNFNLFFLLGFFVWDQVAKLPVQLRPFFWTCLWVGLEFITRPFKIFPEMVGNTQLPWLELSQIASFGGVGAISCYVVFFGFTLYYLFTEKRRRWPIALLLLWGMTGIGIHFWGKSRIAQIQAWPAEKIHVQMVQANIGNTDKAIAISGSIGGIQSVLKAYMDLTREAAAKQADLILWPETAFPIAFPTAETYRAHPVAGLAAQKLQSDAANGKYSLFIGGYEQTRGSEFNSAILIGSDGNVQTSYKKTHLLIFGEYMPFAQRWPWLKQLNPMLGDFGIGDGPFPIRWSRPGKEDILLGANICYEALIMPFMRELAQNGSQVFVNFTNDSWFGPGYEPYQHLMLGAPFRNIENGLAMIRTTNTGISTLIDASGKTISSGPLFAPALIGGDVPIYKPSIETFYRRHGELFSWLVVFFASIMWLGLAYGRLQKINHRRSA